jgi:hypothetical protein
MDAQPVAITDYESLITALRARASELNTPLQSIDDLAGLPDSYVAKILTGHKNIGRISFGPLLGAMALKLFLVPDDEALARNRHRLPPRKGPGPRLEDGDRKRQGRLTASAVSGDAD